MTIHELMNKSPVSPDVRIRVFNVYGDRLIYSGKYDESTPYVYNLDVWEYSIADIETREYNPGSYYIAAATIYADTL